ncbi:hypothetical protein COW36_00320 [bacterium (Candidatus Blackallbacteria) CG17_big_fil_post_rev_8_21_14_2_50_48_46]|uniref:DUF5683 domain-containing protein n=1 Tax=bacterium (Candidatus Blackallbacteria) CG17_big_fil_post_rev_8_21_14_2_50_48_46 TaxID=2014261 RepID=A0A2M7GAW2_9BACT|nr:MAG: hypothetical protein COW64_10850 [bacterium (Candidatus Blackallbacteria) CG18_big_fil_WC_8_21_14_2_50_49_26]PIW19319.1 MAG: hypothetical protein COW36_00320 [bacterium (Candidatus Blackallbacteria) CG17_big_fil_post_rev_8_21_14_2_50_48_46]PIW49077.1 MAG: hypothetical protein COW20_08135 [bacterium (Candidatus Blackallbacteria) CG13_big_fil_rev_8_21_14_2_50_49_14]
MQKNLVIFGLVWCIMMTILVPSGFAESTKTEETLSVQTDETEALEKSPWLAFAFSLALPGSGQMYVEERIWPEVLITVGLALGVAAYFWVDQQRASSIQDRVVRDGSTQRLPEAHWEALTLALQIALPGLWIWNFGDAWRRAEAYNQKVTNTLDPAENAYIMKGSLVSVTLWQF